MDHETSSYLMHHGVKGMKWGVRKKQDRVQTSRTDRKLARIDKRIAKNEAKISKLSSKKHGTARYETMHNLKNANEYHKARKEVVLARKAYKDAKGKGVLKENRARQNYRDAINKQYGVYRKYSHDVGQQRNASRMGYGKSARGSYYKARENGKSTVNATLRATGKATLYNMGKMAAKHAGKTLVAVGAVALTSYLNRKNSNGSSIAALPAYEVINAKHVKVRSVKK